MYNHEHGPIGVKSGPIEAYWDHTFCAMVPTFENGDELEDAFYQDNCIVTASGIAVPITQHCVLSRFAVVAQGDDSVGFGDDVLVQVRKNGVVIETVGANVTWDGQVYTGCGLILDDIFAPCDLLSVDGYLQSGTPLFPISDLRVRVNLGFKLR